MCGGGPLAFLPRLIMKVAKSRASLRWLIGV
jgi:hypothetical protein